MADDFTDFSSSPQDAFTEHSAPSTDKGGLRSLSPEPSTSIPMPRFNSSPEELPKSAASSHAVDVAEFADVPLDSFSGVDQSNNLAIPSKFSTANSWSETVDQNDDFAGFTVAADDTGLESDFGDFTTNDDSFAEIPATQFNPDEIATDPVAPMAGLTASEYRNYLELFGLDDSASSGFNSEELGNFLRTKILDMNSRLDWWNVAPSELDYLPALFASTTDNEGSKMTHGKGPNQFVLPTPNPRFQDEPWCQILRRIQFDLKDPERLLTRYRWRRSAIRKRALIAMGIPINLDETLIDSNPQLYDMPIRERQGSIKSGKGIGLPTTGKAAPDSSQLLASGDRSLSFEEEEILDRAFGQSGPPTPTTATQHVSKPLRNDLALLGNVLSQSSAPSWNQTAVDQFLAEQNTQEDLSKFSAQQLRSTRSRLKELIKQGEEVHKYYQAHCQRIQSENAGYNREIEELVQKAQMARAAASHQKQSTLRNFGWGRK